MDEIYIASPSSSSRAHLSTPKDKEDVIKGLSPWEKWFTSLITIGHFMLCLPIQFDRKRERFLLTRYRSVRAIFYLRTLLFTMDNIYLLCSMPKVNLRTVSSKEYMDFYLHTLTRCVSNLALIALAMDAYSTVQLLNTLMTTRKHWSVKFGWWGDDFSGPVEKRLATYVKFGTIFAPLQGFIPLLMYLESRTSRRYWPAHFFSPEVYNSLPLIIATGLNDWHISTIAVISSSYVGLTVVSVFMLITFWIDNLTHKVMECRRNGSLSSPFTPLRQYKSLVALNRIVTSCIGAHIMPYSVFGAFWVCVGVFTMIIKSFNQLPFPFLLNLIVCSGLLVTALKEALMGGGMLFMKSIELKRLLAMEHTNEYGKRYIRSCRAMRMYTGSFFYVKMSTFLTCFKLLLDQTITALFSL